MRVDDGALKKILIAGSYVDESDIKQAEERIASEGGHLSEHLIALGAVTADIIGQAIAEGFGIPYADLNSHQPPGEQVLKIPEETGKKLRVVLFKTTKRQVVVTTDNPAQKGLIDAVAQHFPGVKIQLAYSLPEDINEALLHYQTPLETRFSKILEQGGRVAPEILEEIFEDAHIFKASDIHFEPRHTDVVVRFRVDGVLKEAGRLPKDYYENIVNRIKVQSQLRIDEHFAAQDGAMQFAGNDNIVFDLRTSIVPTVEGEKIVLRVLGAYIQSYALDDIGLSGVHKEQLEDAMRKPFGMILVTGPTGSGKTTTLYTVLKKLNKPEVNITTIEDPVEYKISGVNQIQVQERTQLTFAKGLRSIVRQDPDVILVGEIRDEETAEVAVNAALTGHLLLSTFHANDAPTAIPRLLDMGIEPFLLSSTLEIVVAQRLVRQLCDSCKYSTVITKKDLKAHYPGVEPYFKSDKKVTLYAGKGCASCGHSGYKGRIGIFEFVRMTPEMQDLVLKNPSSQDIWKLARKQGAVALFDDGIEKVRNGITSIEELMRVAAPR